MADAGAIGVYRAAAVRLPLPVWAAGERAVTVLTRPSGRPMPLSIWAAGERVLTQYQHRTALRSRRAWYVGGTLPSYALPCDGRLAGTVRINNVPQAGKRVLLLYRDSLLLIRSTVTADDGSWEFTELYAPGKYLALAFGEYPGSPLVNAMTADDLTPVLS